MPLSLPNPMGEVVPATPPKWGRTRTSVSRWAHLRGIDSLAALVVLVLWWLAARQGRWVHGWGEMERLWVELVGVFCWALGACFWVWPHCRAAAPALHPSAPIERRGQSTRGRRRTVTTLLLLDTVCLALLLLFTPILRPQPLQVALSAGFWASRLVLLFWGASLVTLALAVKRATPANLSVAAVAALLLYGGVTVLAPVVLERFLVFSSALRQTVIAISPIISSGRAMGLEVVHSPPLYSFSSLGLLEFRYYPWWVFMPSLPVALVVLFLRMGTSHEPDVDIHDKEGQSCVR